MRDFVFVAAFCDISASGWTSSVATVATI